MGEQFGGMEKVVSGKNRLEWMDNAKGIGIILVVATHCMSDKSAIFQYVFTFHMPLFFFLSGCLYKCNCTTNEYAKKRFKQLIIPYFVFLLMGGVLSYLIVEWRELVSYDKVIRDIIYANPEVFNNSSIWFLPCLFFVAIAYDIIYRLSKNEIIKFVIVMALYVLGSQFGNDFFKGVIPFRLPLNLDVAMVAIAFYYTGNIINEKTELLITESVKVKGAIGGISLLTLTYLVYSHNGYVNIHALWFNDTMLYLLGGILGSIGIVMISKTIKPNGIVSGIMGLFGKNSLFILGSQGILIRLYILGQYRISGRVLEYCGFLNWKDTVLCSGVILIILYPSIFAIKMIIGRRLHHK